ncbi:hypothetical protein NWP22_00130 [Anabaenopsis tanganyikae CS-531]|uniref:Uncharacterized protein n=2 Tax=Anabaenopsis TaxID=110103 RepID=A0ABT6K930_9CYAN|nr:MULTISPECIES: hypothetical protein [Anabaenopsis]MDB9541352.1 hypothetical protein [Anabaenopsis arnoldii]MDH6090331.1 hypothetical protein [Anabaenopsis arnoldii]MDH6104305.1 hypothetical protein [Anabaenopsis tanganyikae CS-531]
MNKDQNLAVVGGHIGEIDSLLPFGGETSSTDAFPCMLVTPVTPVMLVTKTV